MATLRDRFDPRRNSFDVLRLSFALLVAVDHGIGIRTGSQARWGLSTLGDFGLDGFFILSGFLVTRSFLTLDSFPRFVWHRFLRIMPGFWVCLLVTAFVVAPLAALAQGLSATTQLTGEPSALRYVFGNASLLIVQYDIAGILADTPMGVSFNGAVWTLFFEAFCYVLVAALGVSGILRRRKIVVALIVGILAVLTILQEAGLPVLVNDRVLRLTLVFLLGAIAYLYAHKIPMRTDLAVGSAIVFLVSVAAFDDYRVLGAAPLAYVLVWFGACFRWPWSMRADLSYGLYIYHWPILQLLVLTGLGTTATPVFVVSGLAIVASVAVLSWFLIEKPALGHKHSPLPDRIATTLSRRRRRPRHGRTPMPTQGRPR
ncbi:acyltransferase [Pseudonocardia sp. KRD291]|uniref:acyltransferase family protein n=1 Tax=Pseudonocardia sp. KRD291 TaxID=2792007 RepID=UPI001C49F875|nr:acyltransferase [Pseudonocardia sp. KRD291]MBW0105478.1 acyltransferase [Pseudonocardia sp. KRD291]